MPFQSGFAVEDMSALEGVLRREGEEIYLPVSFLDVILCGIRFDAE